MVHISRNWIVGIRQRGFEVMKRVKLIGKVAQGRNGEGCQAEPLVAQQHRYTSKLMSEKSYNEGQSLVHSIRIR